MTATNQLSLPGEFPADLRRIGEATTGRYQFVKLLGTGNNGLACEIVASATGRHYCLKAIKPDLHGKHRGRAVESLRKEVEILLPLAHAAIPRVYESSFAKDAEFYICNYHPGKTLAAFLADQCTLNTSNSLALLALLFDAVETMHSLGRSHCDLHSKNLMVSDNILRDGILIVDFGSGHRESDSSPVTENRGNRLFKLGPPTYGQIVDRHGTLEAFRIYDFVALGHLLSQADQAFFADSTPAQRGAFRSFYSRLAGQALTDWKGVRKAMLQVADPFRIVNEMELLFQTATGNTQTIPLPISRGVAVGDASLAVINCKVFQRLRGIQQLSFCSWYFPGATHTRFEHSLGVFHLVHLALKELAWSEEFRDTYSGTDLKACLLAGLLHDVGHYPFAHMMEHYAASRFANNANVREETSHGVHSMHLLKSDPELRTAISQYWGDFEDCVSRVESLLNGRCDALRDLLDGPIDCDKLDYLARDAFHCGLPYARGLDAESFLRSTRCLPGCKGLAVSIDGVPALEGFLVLQEHMLANVYWNEWIRAVIGMFHAALAHIVKENEAAFLNLVRRLKASPSDSVALTEVLIPMLSKASKDPGLLNLVRLHTEPHFASIYRSVAVFRHFDTQPSGKRSNVFSQLVTWTPSNTSSSIPVNWSVVRELRRVFMEEFKKEGCDTEGYEIIIDVPTGKNALRRVQVLAPDNQVVDISKTSHLNDTIFTHPAAFASPIRVFVSPRVYAKVESRILNVVRSAVDAFLK